MNRREFLLLVASTVGTAAFGCGDSKAPRAGKFLYTSSDFETEGIRVSHRGDGAVFDKELDNNTWYRFQVDFDSTPNTSTWLELRTDALSSWSDQKYEIVVGVEKRVGYTEFQRYGEEEFTEAPLGEKGAFWLNRRWDSWETMKKIEESGELATLDRDVQVALKKAFDYTSSDQFHSDSDMHLDQLTEERYLKTYGRDEMDDNRQVVMKEGLFQYKVELL